jgi:hypothetical protein
MLSLCKVTDNDLWVFSFTLGLFSMIDDVNIITTVISPWSCNMTSFEQTAAWQSHSALPLTQQVFRSLVFYAWLFGCLSHSAQHRALVFPNASHFKRCHALLCDRLICITCLSTIHLDGKLERSLVSLFSLLYVLLFSSILTDLYRSIKALVDPAIWGGEWRQGIIDWKKRWHYLVYRTIFEQISGGEGMYINWGAYLWCCTIWNSHIMMLPVQIWMELLVNLHCHKQSQTITKGLFASIGFNPVGIIDTSRKLWWRLGFIPDRDLIYSSW